MDTLISIQNMVSFCYLHIIHQFNIILSVNPFLDNVPILYPPFYTLFSGGIKWGHLPDMG